MKILQCHNYYQVPGGEDQCFRDEAQSLRDHGHEVVQFTMHNDAVKSMGKLGLLAKTFWNRESYREVRQIIRRERPDVMHCTNTFPLISPSVYAAARVEGVAVVQALHNFRLLCPNAYFLRDGRPCEDCLGKLLAWPGIRHACYRESRAATSVVAAMFALHRLLGTWQNSVDAFYTVSEFARTKFLAAGFPAEKLLVKLNAVFRDPGSATSVGEYAVFLGRLQPEKGISTLLDAWARLPDNVPLKIVGDGPLADDVKRACERDSRIEWLGWKKREEVDQILQNAAFLVMPSIWYETFGLTIVEAYAAGRPVVASRLGAMAELVGHGRTGQLFEAGNADALSKAVAVQWHKRHDCQAMRSAARAEYETKYTAAASYARLLHVYETALANASSKRSNKNDCSRLPTASEGLAAGGERPFDYPSPPAPLPQGERGENRPTPIPNLPAETIP